MSLSACSDACGRPLRLRENPVNNGEIDARDSTTPPRRMSDRRFDDD
jgi:hypothetical protein